MPHRDSVTQDPEIQGTSQTQVTNAATSVDLADEVKGMYRVLDLISESGTNGCGT